jgi:hypothetical protein
MASASPLPDLVGRIIEYARETKIEFRVTPRLSSWRALGLPDIRGFCPHLRRINLYKDQENLKNLKNLEKRCNQEIKKGNAFQGLWLIHDILHIAFYDFATLNLGVESWNQKERFLENHLASELFSVLTLDYFYLIFTKVKGLAVDLDFKKWRQFQKVNPFLPELGSFDLCSSLFELYFTGRSSLIEGQRGSKDYKDWVGHEERYASKQRRYVLQWWDDLEVNSDSKKEALIVGSEVHFAVWELINIFFNSGQREWSAYLKKTPQSKNVFSEFRKYENKNLDFDFRFTDIQALKKSEILANLKKAKEPSPSSLFLLWQMISIFETQRFDRRTLQAVTKLAKASNGNLPLNNIWDSVWLAVQRAVKDPHFSPGPADKSTLSTFFLP